MGGGGKRTGISGKKNFLISFHFFFFNFPFRLLQFPKTSNILFLTIIFILYIVYIYIIYLLFLYIMLLKWIILIHTYIGKNDLLPLFWKYVGIYYIFETRVPKTRVLWKIILWKFLKIFYNNSSTKKNL